jgi:hypothetical protein
MAGAPFTDRVRHASPAKGEFISHQISAHPNLLTGLGAGGRADFLRVQRGI